MGIKHLYNDNLRKLPNEYGDVSVMFRHYMYIMHETSLNVDLVWSASTQQLCMFCIAWHLFSFLSNFVCLFDLRFYSPFNLIKVMPNTVG